MYGMDVKNVNSIVKIVDLLYSWGHRKIGFIHGDKHSFISNERFAGYIIGQNIHDLEYNPNYVYYGDGDTVIYQSPDQGEKIKEEDTIMLYLGWLV